MNQMLILALVHFCIWVLTYQFNVKLILKFGKWKVEMDFSLPTKFNRFQNSKLLNK